MNLRFLTPEIKDKRVVYAAQYLEEGGYLHVKNPEHADFILLGVNSKSDLSEYSVPVFAGNVSGCNVYDYTKNDVFAMKNAYLTAEAALAITAENSENSLVNAKVLITGYGRIAKALHRYLTVLTPSVTVCARSPLQRAEAQSKGAHSIGYSELTDCAAYEYIFNTVPHPVFGDKELSGIGKDTLLLELASFPGGIDSHIARVKGLRLVTARGLPGIYSPAASGRVLGETVTEMLRDIGLG